MFGTSASGQYGVSGEACPSLLLAGGWAGPWGEACAGKNDGGCHYLGWLRHCHRRLSERLRSDDITETGLLIHFAMVRGQFANHPSKELSIEKKSNWSTYCIWHIYEGLMSFFIKTRFVILKNRHNKGWMSVLPATDGCQTIYASVFPAFLREMTHLPLSHCHPVISVSSSHKYIWHNASLFLPDILSHRLLKISDMVN